MHRNHYVPGIIEALGGKVVVIWRITNIRDKLTGEADSG